MKYAILSYFLIIDNRFFNKQLHFRNQSDFSVKQVKFYIYALRISNSPMMEKKVCLKPA